MAEQEFMFTSPSHSSLENLPIFVPRNRKDHLWKMDQNILAQKGIKIPNENKYFSL
jgi:hypothetical protein